MKAINKRFNEFKSVLLNQLGDKAVLLADGETVLVLANDFSPLRSFPTVQSAIDNFARFMPDNLK